MAATMGFHTSRPSWRSLPNQVSQKLRRTLLGSAFSDLLDVLPGREGAVAGAGDEGYPGVVVLAEVHPYLAEGLVHGAVEGVEDLGAVEGNVGDVVTLLVEDGARPSPFFSGRS